MIVASRSVSDLGRIGCKMTRPVHSSPLSCANRTTIRLKIVKLCPRPAHFSLRFPKSDSLLGRLNAYDGAPLHALDSEHDLAMRQREQGVVFAHADVVAGMEARAALPHDDAAGGDEFAAEGFDAQHFRI